MNYSNFYHVAISSEIGGVKIESMLDNGFVHPEMLDHIAHFHTTYEVHLCLTGSYTVEAAVTGKKTRLSPGKLLIIPPNCYHYTVKEPVGEGGLPSKYSFRFRLAQTESKKGKGGKVIASLPPDEADPVTLDAEWALPLFRSIREEIISGRRYNKIIIDSLMTQFWVLLFRAISNADESADQGGGNGFMLSQSDAPSAREEKIIMFINRNYSSQITEKDLAEELNISVRQLSRICVDVFGKSFRDVLTDIRIRRAMRLLESGDSPSEQISYDVGYAAPSSFYSVFRKKVGMTPNQYRKHMKRKATEDK